MSAKKNIIHSKEQQRYPILKEIEQDFRRYLKLRIEDCENLEQIAKEGGQNADTAYYGTKIKIYRDLLKSYAHSDRYFKP